MVLFCRTLRDGLPLIEYRIERQTEPHHAVEGEVKLFRLQYNSITGAMVMFNLLTKCNKSEHNAQ